MPDFQHLGQWREYMHSLDRNRLLIKKLTDKLAVLCTLFLRRGPTKPEVLTIQQPGRRSSRRLQRNNSFSPVSPLFNAGWLDEDNQWVTQINRLQKLIDRLEQKDLKLEPQEEEVSEGNINSLMIVQRQMSVIPEELEQFRHALKQYVDTATSQDGCLHVSIQRLSKESRFTVYEFWENNAWNSNLQMNYSKTFQRSNVDCLKTPENITTMLVPGSSIFLFFSPPFLF
ncbi:hypothetical protein lerEdw1_008906 [Lerista edwardsae]|nr:hypothetical protein lerEdw1_008906 [Lerista edwardsae]